MVVIVHDSQNMVEVWSRDSGPGVGAAEHSAKGSLERFAERSSRENSAAVAVEEEDMCFVYPMLQPVVTKGGAEGGELAWSANASTGFLRFSVSFANPFNRCGMGWYGVGYCGVVLPCFLGVGFRSMGCWRRCVRCER